MKRLLFLKLLALVACLSSALSASAYSFSSVYNGKTIYYNITSSANRTVEVTYKESDSYSYNAYSGAVTIPSTVTYNNTTYTVTAIGESAFENASGLTSISIPNTVTSIGAYAFTISEGGANSNGLTSVTIPNSVTSIGERAFSKCYLLKTLNLGTGLTSIPTRCFYDCALTSVTIPSSVNTIGEEAFRANASLTTVDVGNNVTRIEDGAFYNCTSLATVTLGFSVTSIGYHAFASNDGNHHWIDVYCYTVTPPTIDEYTFDRWDNNGGIYGYLYTLARKVNAFKQHSIWSRFGTSNIRSQSGNEIYDFNYNGLYYYLDGTSNLFNPYVYVTYKDTNYNSYSGSNVVLTATVPWRSVNLSVVGIGENAFRNCTGLQTFSTFSATKLQSIGENAFRNCTGLTSFDASQAPNLSHIYGYAFYGCTSLSTVKLRSEVETINNYAFYNCPLRWFTVDCSTPPTVYANTFTGDYNNGMIIVPTPADILTYKATDYWKKFLQYSSIRSWDFLYDGLYYAITSSNTVKVVRSNLSEFGPYTNYYGNITVPQTVPYNETTYSVTAIDDFAFSQRVADNKLAANGEPMIGDPSSQLTSVTIGSNVKTIGTRAFEYADALTRISIPNNVTSIGDEAFLYCSGLTQVSIGSGVSSIGSKTFCGCTSLTNITIPNSITTLGANAFNGCTALRNVTLGNSLSSIGNYAFSGCTNLYFINCLRNTPPTIQSSTFPSSLYSSNAKVVVQNTSAETSYKAATYWKNFSNIWTIDKALTTYVKTSDGVTLTTSGSYPWVMQVDNGRCLTTSGNYGQHSTSSVLTATVTVPANRTGTLSFIFKAWGEGSSYDKCIFKVDGTQKFSYGARDNDWESYSVELAAGTHTLTWTYQKDSSVNPVGDYFAVDDVTLQTQVDASAGDVNGDGSATIADVSALIDLLLGNGTAPAAADVNGDGSITIADVSALIDLLLGS